METIDVEGLPEDQVRMLREFAEFLKAKSTKEGRQTEKIELARWSLGVKGNLTREEIYEDR